MIQNIDEAVVDEAADKVVQDNATKENESGSVKKDDELYSLLEQHVPLFFERLVNRLVDNGLVDFEKGEVYFPAVEGKRNTFPINEYFYSNAFPITCSQQIRVREFSKDTIGIKNKRFKPLEAMLRSGAANLGIFPERWAREIIFTSQEIKAWLFLEKGGTLYDKFLSRFKVKGTEENGEFEVLTTGKHLANIYHKLLDYLFIQIEKREVARFCSKSKDTKHTPIFENHEEFVEPGEAYQRLITNLERILRTSGIEKRQLINHRSLETYGSSSENESTDISSIALLLLPTYGTIRTAAKSPYGYTYDSNGDYYKITDLEEMIVHIASLHCFDYKMNIPVNIVYYDEMVKRTDKDVDEQDKDIDESEEGIEQSKHKNSGVAYFLIDPANEEPVKLDELERNRFILLNLALYPMEGNLVMNGGRIVGATGKLKMLYDIAKQSIPDDLNHRDIPLYLKRQFLPVVDLF